jgi:6-pyruvoyltetrahydropterin/6-carboxytetrahydropterin synthase
LFTISVQTSFWASHQLKLPSGKRENIHSHNWLVQAQLSSEQLNKMGLVFDFNRLKTILTAITDTLTDSPLEDNPYFQQNNSSAEMIAKYIYQSLEKKLPDGISLDLVTVIEELGCSACFKKTTM